MRKTRYYKALIASTISKPDSSGLDRGIQLESSNLLDTTNPTHRVELLDDG